MALVDIKNLEGRTMGQVDLADDVFSRRVNPHLLHEVTRWYLRSQRAGTHKTKGRGEVSGSGNKLWRQKGTGRARVGSIRSSIWRKGGTVHGPQPRSYAYALPRKMVLGALRSALSAKLAEQKLTVVEGWPLETHKTGKFRQTFDAAPCRRSDVSGGGAGRKPELGAGQPQSGRRQAGNAEGVAGLRSLEARAVDAVERYGAAARSHARHGRGSRGGSAAQRPPGGGRPRPAKAAAAAEPKAGQSGRQGCETQGAQVAGQAQGPQGRGIDDEDSVYLVIRRPIVTEKGLGVKETQQTVVFEVSPQATKTEIKEAVQQIFKVKVEAVRTLLCHGKFRRRGAPKASGATGKKRT